MSDDGYKMNSLLEESAGMEREREELKAANAELLAALVALNDAYFAQDIIEAKSVADEIIAKAKGE